jgi:hypothetical protein
VTWTHLGIDKDAPNRRPIERCGVIVANAVLGGLHHRYARIYFGRDGSNCDHRTTETQSIVGSRQPVFQSDRGREAWALMPILPLDHPEPFAATLGVMLYPATDEEDPPKARAFAAQVLAEPVRRLREALSYEALARIVIDAGQRLTDLDKRWWDGSAVGEVFKILLILAHTHPKLASWDNAIEYAEMIAARDKVKGSRANLWKARKRFLSVAHLWGCPFRKSDPDVLVVQSSQDGNGGNGARSLDRSMQRRIVP